MMWTGANSTLRQTSTGGLIEVSKLVGLAREVGREAAHEGMAKKWGT